MNVFKNKKINNLISVLAIIVVFGFYIYAIHDMQVATGIGLYFALKTGSDARKWFDIASDMVRFLLLLIVTIAPCLFYIKSAVRKRLVSANGQKNSDRTKSEPIHIYLRFLLVYLSFTIFISSGDLLSFFKDNFGEIVLYLIVLAVIIVGWMIWELLREKHQSLAKYDYVLCIVLLIRVMYRMYDILVHFHL